MKALSLFLPTVVVLCLSGSTVAQEALWSRVYGGADWDHALEVQPTADGGYIAAGYTESFGAGEADFYLVKTDTDGNTEWTRAYGGTDDDWGWSVQQTSDGGYVVAGYTLSFGAGVYDVYLVKTNASGAVQWSRAYGGSGLDFGYAVRQTADGGYIVTGKTTSFGDPMYDVYLLKIDSGGTIQWSKTYGGADYDWGWAVEQTADGGYVIVGTTSSFGIGSNEVYLIKTDAGGNLVWSQTYGGATGDYGYSVQQTDDGGFIVAATTESFGPGPSNAYLIKTNSGGAALWTRAYGGAQETSSTSVRQTLDGGYVVTGGTECFDADSADVLVMKTDGGGNVLWGRIYGGVSQDGGWSVRQVPGPGKGYIVAGYSRSYGAGDYDVVLTELDSLGVTCIGDFVSPNVMDVSSDVSAPATTESFVASETNDPASVETAPSTVVTTVCYWPPPGGVALWSRAYGGSGWEGGFSVDPTTDGGYAVAGETPSFGAGGYDVYLVKTDSSGALIWSSTYGGSDNDEAAEVQQTADGGYIMAGFTVSFGAGSADVYLLKTGANGALQWSSTFGGTGVDQGTAAQQTADGGYIIAGKTTSFGAGGYDFYLLKTAANGALQWSRTYGGDFDEWPSSVQQTSDGGYIVAGWTLSFGIGSNEVYLVKTDAAGNLQWSRTYGGSFQDFGRAVRQTSDGGYIVAGSAASFGGNDIYLIKTDGLGSELWARTYGGTSPDDGQSVRQTADGGYIVAGITESFGAQNTDASLMKTDAAGNLTWAWMFGDENYDYSRSVKQLAGGAKGYIVAGDTRSFGAGHFDVWLTRFDSDGNTCIGGSVSPTVTAVSSDVTDPPTQVGDASTIALSVPTESSSPNSVVTIVCEEVRDIVVCEPQGGSPHPPTYWYDVTPGGIGFGRCDFHVQVFDSVAANYSNWVEPNGWTHQVHKAGNDWWVSWWNDPCTSAIFNTFRFQFDNDNPAIWGDWRTTTSGTSNPFAEVVDSAANHTGEADGYGYRVHVPELELEWGRAVDEPIDLTPYCDWGAISSWPGLSPPGWMGIWSPSHQTFFYFPSDSSAPPVGTTPRAWLVPGIHLATFFGPDTAHIPADSNFVVTVPDRNSRPCSLLVLVPPANLIDQATDLNVIQISSGEITTISINSTVETMAFLANCDGAGYCSPDQPLEVRLNYDDGTADTVVFGIIHPGERANNVLDRSWYTVYGNEIFGCGPFYCDVDRWGTPNPYYTDSHSEFWHWYTIYPDTAKVVISVSFVGIQSGDPSEIYIFALSVNACDCMPGDCDGNGTLNVSDAVRMIGYIFAGGPPCVPYQLCSCDADCNCICNVSDVVYMINFIFGGGPPPCTCSEWLAQCGPPLRK